MKKVILFSLASLPLLLLSGCGNQEEIKQLPFYIDTQKVSDFAQRVVLIKPGKIVGSEEITVTSQVSGRIGKVFHKEWEKLLWGQQVIDIKDSIANYGLQVQRAKNAFDRSILQYDQTKITLDKNNSDLENALSIAQNTYDITQKIAEQTLRKANLDYQNANVSTENLQLQLAVEKNALLNLLEPILHQMDTYMGVTDQYRSYNDAYERLLWAEDPTQKTNTENLLKELYSIRDSVKAIKDDQPSTTELEQWIEILNKWYTKARTFLDAMKTVFINTIVSVDFSQTRVDAAKSSIDGLLSSLQLANTSFTAYRKQILSSLATSSGAIVSVWEEFADVSYQTTLINTENSLFNTEIWVKTAKINYDTFTQTKDLQLGLVQNAVMDSNVSYQDALTRFNKLSVRAPIQWVIWSVFVDVWQEVAPGTPLFSIINTSSQLVDVFVDVNELALIQLDQNANIHYYDSLYTGKVVAISRVAEKNGLYKVIVWLSQSVDLIGWVATVDLQSNIANPLLPVNIVSVLSQNTGAITVVHGTGLMQYFVRLGQVWSDRIEILSTLPLGLEIVTNDVANFDPRRYQLVRKQ